MNEKLKEIVATVFEIDPDSVNENTSTETVEAWDSMNHMNLIIAVEEEFGIKIFDDDAVELLSFSELSSYLERNS